MNTTEKMMMILNGHVTEDDLVRFAKDSDKIVRMAVTLYRPSQYDDDNIYNYTPFPEKVASILVSDPDKYVRMLLANNGYLSDTDEAILARDNDRDVRLTIANKSVISDEVFEILINDSDEEVRNCVKKNFS